MAIIDYPDWLPLAQKASKNMTFDTGFQTDQPAVGPAIFQSLTDDLKATWSLTWIFTLDEERAFQQWLRSPNYLNRGVNWFRMPINIGGSGLQVQELHFTQMPVQTSIDGGVVTWTGTVIANHLYNPDDEFDDIIVELPPPWGSLLDEVVTEDLPEYVIKPDAGIINLTLPDLDRRISFTRAGTASYVDGGYSISQAQINEWPLQFLYGTGRAEPERESTNVFQYSNNLGAAAWRKYYITATTGYPAPDGSNLACKLIPDAAAGIYELVQAEHSSIGTGDNYTTYVFAKSSGYSNLQIRWTGGSTGTSGKYANFDLTTGEVAGNAENAGTIRFYDGWWLCYATTELTGSATAAKDIGFCVIQSMSQTRRPTWTANGVDGILLWGAQTENKTLPTSFIYTESAPVTRSPEFCFASSQGTNSVSIHYSDGTVKNVDFNGQESVVIPYSETPWGFRHINYIEYV